MRRAYILLAALLFYPWILTCQSPPPAPYQLSGGLISLTNSFDGVPGSHSPLLGWNAAAAFPSWRGLRFKMEFSRFSGTNLQAPQHAYFVMAGGEYGRTFGRERVYGHALFGDGGLNRNWGANGTSGMTATFVYLLGGGVDTPVNPHFAIRVEGDMQHTNLALVAKRTFVPYRISGLPGYFGRFSAGVVWTPRLAAMHETAIGTPGPPPEPPESEVAYEESNSVGHYHIFASSKWSYLHVAGAEYDRHSWGQFLRADMDYVAEILPVVIMQQPSKTDVWGNPRTVEHQTVEGLGVTPIGLRLFWRPGSNWRPYYTAKIGMIAFTQKALSQYASYANFSLQQATGIEFRVHERWDVRAGVSDFHFSNAFMVPNNPGIDEMMYGGALCYRLTGRSAVH